ncbi:MAG: hypothetical protein HYY84_14325 [Deltaproteobacteria bacterium]|nr:hypothetical protein [Deltaproteobacteria bacterium]
MPSETKSNESKGRDQAAQSPPLGAEETTRFVALRATHARYLSDRTLVERGEQVATLDICAATRNLVGEVRRHAALPPLLAKLGFDDARLDEIVAGADHLETSYRATNSLTIDVSETSAKVRVITAKLKVIREQIATATENALPMVYAVPVARAAVPSGGRPAELAKSVEKMVATVREVPAENPEYPGANFHAALENYGAGSAVLGEAMTLAGALVTAAAERDATHRAASGPTAGRFDLYDGVLFEAGKRLGRAAKVAARQAGEGSLRISLRDELNRVARARGRGPAIDVAPPVVATPPTAPIPR